MSDKQGQEVILRDSEPSEFFGEMGLIAQAPRSATVTTIEPCELLTITRADFNKCLQGNFDLTMNVIRGLVKRLREADKKIGSLALMDVYDASRDFYWKWPNRRRAESDNQEADQAGHREDDRGVARDGEPRYEGTADERANRGSRGEILLRDSLVLTR